MSAHRTISRDSLRAGLETCDTADSEVCATQLGNTPVRRLKFLWNSSEIRASLRRLLQEMDFFNGLLGRGLQEVTLAPAQHRKRLPCIRWQLALRDRKPRQISDSTQLGLPAKLGSALTDSCYNQTQSLLSLDHYWKAAPSNRRDAMDAEKEQPQLHGILSLTS
jgi:hypothetical protein